jgi:hypothetical protein
MLKRGPRQTPGDAGDRRDLEAATLPPLFDFGLIIFQ